jgi:hypothetical protein
MPKILCYDLVLHDISQAIVDNDISIFFEQNLGIIRRECALPADWPGKQTITYLVQSAGGLLYGLQLPTVLLETAGNLLKIVCLVSSKATSLLTDQKLFYLHI